MELDINDIRNTVNNYLAEMQQNSSYSIKLIKIKMDNYCMGVKGELQYKFYKMLKEKGYVSDEISRFEEQINTKINSLAFKFNYQDEDIEIDSFDDFKEKVNSYVKKFLNVCEKYSDYDLNDEKNRKLIQVSDQFYSDYKTFRIKINRTCINNNINLKSLDYDVEKLLNSRYADKKIAKRPVRIKLDSIKQALKKNVEVDSINVILKNANIYINNIINVYEEVICDINNQSKNEENIKYDHGNNETNKEHDINNSVRINNDNSIETEELRKKAQVQYDRYNSMFQHNISDKSNEFTNQTMSNEKSIYDENNSVPLSINKPSVMAKHTDKSEGIIISSISVETSDNKKIRIIKPLDKEGIELYEEIQEKLLKFMFLKEGE